jgi:predicted Zn finger-like uncharacterized protein
VQVNCPNCSQRIVIDDAKIPDRPFKVKCPKCQTSVSLPGKSAAPMPDAPMPEPVPPSPPQPAAAGGADEMRSQMMAQLRREMSLGETVGGGGRALVCLSDRGVAGAITVTLTRLGYQVDTIEDPEEGARLLEQGVYSVVATSRSAPAGPKGENLYQRTNRLSPEARRRLFLLLMGDEYKTGDGTQAWTTVADFVLNTRETSSADTVLRNTLAERARLYQVFLDARRRFEETAG